MKKIVLLLGFLFCVLMVQSQDKYITSGTYGTFWGTSADTLQQMGALGPYTFRIQLNKPADLVFQDYVTKTSGTVTCSFVVARSMDGTTYTNIDTISMTGASTGLQSDYVKIDNANWPYIKVVALTPGSTAQLAKHTMYYRIVEE